MLLACVYEPEPFEAEVVESTNQGDVVAVNVGQQICNPSVSQDTANYPGALLWLNFTKLSVKVKPADTAAYTMKRIVQHDRLTVTDTSNTVRWFLMRDTSAKECQFQDPEWSTHPNYLVALRGYDVGGSKACDDLDYGIFAVRMSDKKKFWFYEKNIIEEATPHLWVDPSAELDTSSALADSTIEGFFGTKNVRLVYVSKKDEIVFVDFGAANGDFKKALGKAMTLKKPSDRSSWTTESPMISPDGNYVVYNMMESSTHWESYVQELGENTSPVLVESSKGGTSEPAQPHWFQFGSRLFVLWAEFPSGSNFVNRADLSQASVQNGSAGRTMMREISLLPGVPADLLWLGDAYEIAPVPMIGGRSPDGKFLVTGTNYGFVLELP